MDDLFEGLLIFSVEFSHLPDDEAFFDGGEDGFGWFYPAGDGHEDEIGAAALIGDGADHHGRPLFVWSVKGKGIRTTSPQAAGWLV